MGADPLAALLALRLLPRPPCSGEARPAGRQACSRRDAAARKQAAGGWDMAHRRPSLLDTGHRGRGLGRCPPDRHGSGAGRAAIGRGDALRHAGFNVFGPDRGAGRIESSKSFAKDLMRRAGIRTADFETFAQPAPARAWARERGGRVAVKADGLARGKGVIVCGGVEESDQAIEAILVAQRFGRGGAQIVVEERLEGPELSVLGVTDGTDVVALAPARDYKRANEADTGPHAAASRPIRT